MNFLIPQYLLLAVITIYGANRLSFYLDQMDRKTRISSILLGGVLLAAVTALPELITTLTATIRLRTPGLAFGNIFGSNMLNLLILSIVDLIFIRHLFYNRTSAGVKTGSLVLMMYLLFLIPVGLFAVGLFDLAWLDISAIITFNLISLAVILLYLFTVKKMKEDVPGVSRGESRFTLRVIIVRFTLFSVLVIIAAYLVTLTADRMGTRYGLGASFAGAVFLGAATSLPEVATVVSLFRLGNFDAALGNILGSSLYNILILSFVDIIHIRDSIYLVFEDPSQLKNISLLLILGTINSIIVIVALLRKPPTSKVLYAMPSITIILSYILYIVLSF